jgi:hypothetical protein
MILKIGTTDPKSTVNGPPADSTALCVIVSGLPSTKLEVGALACVLGMVTTVDGVIILLPPLFENT